MRRKMKKIWILCFIIILMWAMTGCDDGMESIKEDTQKSEESVEEEEVQPTKAPVQETLPPTATPEPEVTPAPTSTVTPEPTAIPTPEPQESLPPKVIEYGDKVSITYTKTSQELQWKYTGTQEFQVATTSKQFQNEFDDSEKAAMKQVEKAIGKTVGDTFTLWYERGDGRYGYEYTIVEVKSQNPDIAEYGDKIFTNYVSRGLGVDTGDGKEVCTGEQVLHLKNNDTFLADTQDGYSINMGEERLSKILGKNIGERFLIEKSSYESDHYYKYTITGISKAIKYGDTIITEVREANSYNANTKDWYSEKTVILDLTTETGGIMLEEDNLLVEDSRALCKEVVGKTVGDRVVFVREEDTRFTHTRYVYNMEIYDVEESKQQQNDEACMEKLLTAPEDEVALFYNYSYENPTLEYMIISDKDEKRIYEYTVGTYNCYLNWAYEYIDEYDKYGRLVKETYGGFYSDRILEYKYDEYGHCIEKKESYSDNESYYYYDNTGKIIKAEHLYNGEKTILELIYEGDSLIKTMQYNDNGEVWVLKYDNWGFLMSKEQLVE